MFRIQGSRRFETVHKLDKLAMLIGGVFLREEAMYIMFLGETITNYHAVGVIVLHIFVVNGEKNPLEILTN